MNNNGFYEIAGLTLFEPSNSVIRGENGFPVLFTKSKEGEKRVGVVEAKRAFPFECENEYIVLEDGEGRDLGVIRDLAARSESERAVLGACLERRYYMPKIRGLYKVSDKFGFCYFKASTDAGDVEFSVHDPYKSIVLLGRRMILTDADGNRFEIPDVDALPKKDRKKIEQFLY
ncbi:MAG: DUF1854 domain-containing protein [Clostridia bacterium]|nr:DUF1854 domain-containing protein [Clostridia bacterium]